MARLQEKFNLWFPLGIGGMFCGAALLWPSFGAVLFSFGAASAIGALAHLRLTLFPSITCGMVGGVVVWVGLTAVSPNQQPDVVLELAHAERPALILKNQSSIVAMQIKYSVLLWDLDNVTDWTHNTKEKLHQPLPIRARTFDFLRPNEEGMSQNLLEIDSNLVPLKDGDRIIGSAAVECPDCRKSHVYIVDFIYGRGGWYADVSDIASGKLLVPTLGTPGGVVAYAGTIEAMVPQRLRIAIPK